MKDVLIGTALFLVSQVLLVSMILFMLHVWSI
jgi:hypothetical protein